MREEDIEEGLRLCVSGGLCLIHVCVPVAQHSLCRGSSLTAFEWDRGAGAALFLQALVQSGFGGRGGSFLGGAGVFLIWGAQQRGRTGPHQWPLHIWHLDRDWHCPRRDQHLSADS